jgi:hypothetical protein
LRTASGKSIRALIDTLEKIPPSAFGDGRARILRKLTLVAIAKYADPDGSNSMPSTATLARICLVTERAIRQTVEWLEQHGLLRVEYKAGRNGCNRYMILFPDAQPEETPGTAVPRRPGIDVPGTPGTMDVRPGTTVPADPEIENASLPSSYRPLDREREQTEKRSRSRSNSLQAKPDVEADAVRVESTVRGWGLPLTDRIQKTIRRRLRQGVVAGMLEYAITAAMKRMPRDEHKPHFYLGQNLDAEVEAILRHGDEAWQATELADSAEPIVKAMAAGRGAELPYLPRSER